MLLVVVAYFLVLVFFFNGSLLMFVLLSLLSVSVFAVFLDVDHIFLSGMFVKVKLKWPVF